VIALPRLSTKLRKRRFVQIPALALALLSVRAYPQGPVPVGELFASDVSGSTQLAGSGMTVVSGSELSAGIAPATLKLYRGGQVRICPHSGLGVSAGGHGLMLATGAGAVEINYELAAQAEDVVITPDFNVTLVGPGSFHFALEVTKRGDTCVKPLPGNAGQITFSELLGSASYRTRPDELAFFPGGKVEGHTTFTGECGCPPGVPVLRAEKKEPVPPPTKENPPSKPADRVMVATTGPAAPTAPTPPGQPGDVHVQVDAPFVFSARSGPRPYSVARLQISTLPNVFFVQEQVDPLVLVEKPAEVSLQAETAPPQPLEKPHKEKKGFMGKIKGFFGSLFHR
jgi:hypothetical protein